MKKNKRKENNTLEIISQLRQLFLSLLDWCVCIYMLLILMIMPFYNEEGFQHIGTDKSSFFRQCTIHGSKIILPVVLVIAVLSLIIQRQKSGLWAGKDFSFKKGVEMCKRQFSVTDAFALAYGICAIASYLGSHYKEEALWGTKGWYMGLIPQLTFVSVYFLVSRAWVRRKWIAASVFPVSAVVFVLGYFNRFGIYPIDMQLKLPDFISTIGNINWYCGYFVSVFFAGMFLLWSAEQNAKGQKVLLTVYVMIGFATLVTQGSNSGIFAAAVIFLMFFCLSSEDGGRMEMFWLEMVLFSLACLVTYLLRVVNVLESTMIDTVSDILTYSIIPIFATGVSLMVWMGVRWSSRKHRYPQQFFVRLARFIYVGVPVLLGLYIIVLVINTAHGGAITRSLGMPEDNFLRFSTKWGSNRGATWTCAWLCFAEQDLLHKLIGVGPDCMAAFLYGGGSDELVSMVKECFGEVRLTNAHNEWLTILVNMGVLGFVSFVGMITSAIRRYLKARNRCVIAAACGVCLLAYTVNNMFSFQQSMSVATIFVIFGIGENYIRAIKKVI